MAIEPTPAGGATPGLGIHGKLAILLEVTKAMSAETDFDRLLQLIMRETTRAMEADRSTLFLLDAEKGELWSKIAQGLESEEIRFSATMGVAGHVASTGMTLNIPDAYQDQRFNPDVDRKTGYRTRTILCMPVRKNTGEIIGVLQVLNKRKGIFTWEDEALLEALASQAAIAIENARLYEDLRRANIELRQLDQMKSNFLANISHELRTPLAPIIGYVEVLLTERPGPLSPSQRSALDVVSQAVGRLQGLIEDLLTFVQMDQGEIVVTPQRLSIEAVLRERCEAFLRKAQEKKVEFHHDVPGGLPDVSADPKEIGRAVALLLDNAIKFTPAGGHVSLAAAADAGGAWVEIAVRDSGIGIPADKLPRIFDRFYQVDASSTRRHGGTGLGLALVKQIVEAHGSKVEVESQVGAGSVFRFRLPAAP